MNHDQLPDGLTPKGSSAIFTEKTLPAALLTEHALAAKRWATLQILEGTASFVDLHNGKVRQVAAPSSVIIGPECPHKLRLHGGTLRCRIDFFQETENAI